MLFIPRCLYKRVHIFKLVYYVGFKIHLLKGILVTGDVFVLTAVKVTIQVLFNYFFVKFFGFILYIKKYLTTNPPTENKTLEANTYYPMSLFFAAMEALI